MESERKKKSTAWMASDPVGKKDLIERLSKERQIEEKRLEVSERLLAWADILELKAPE